MAEDDIMLRMSLDIEDVEEKLTRIKAQFDGLGEGLSGLSGFSAQMDRTTESVERMTAAFKEAGDLIQKTTVVKSAANAADAKTVQIQNEATKALKARAAAEAEVAKEMAKRVEADRRSWMDARGGGNADLANRDLENAARVEYSRQLAQARRRHDKRPVYEDIYHDMRQEYNKGNLSFPNGDADPERARLVNRRLREMSPGGSLIAQKRDETLLERQERLARGAAQKANREQFERDKDLANGPSYVPGKDASASTSAFSKIFAEEDKATAAVRAANKAILQQGEALLLLLPLWEAQIKAEREAAAVAQRAARDKFNAEKDAANAPAGSRAEASAAAFEPLFKKQDKERQQEEEDFEAELEAERIAKQEDARRRGVEQRARRGADIPQIPASYVAYRKLKNYGGVFDDDKFIDPSSIKAPKAAKEPTPVKDSTYPLGPTMGAAWNDLSRDAQAYTLAIKNLKAEQSAAIPVARELNEALRGAGGYKQLAAQLNAQAEEEGRAANYTAAGIKSVTEESNKLAGIRPKSFASTWTREIASMGEMALKFAAVGVAISVVQGLMEEFTKSLERASEFQVQGVLFDSYKRNLQNTASAYNADPANANKPKMPGVDSATSGDVLTRSIQLAAKYGDEVNDVSQDVSLWYKRTGDLNDALFLTNETLKFQTATGTDLEDTYRTLTGLAAQAGSMKLDKGDTTSFGLEKTPELMEKITAASEALGAGFHQVSKNGFEMGKANNNAAVLLLEAMDKDTAALGTLGYSVSQAVAFNASLIQSFGNTGEAASEAADKIGRIAGGIASFSKPGNATVKAFAKEMQSYGGDPNALSKAVNSKDGDVIKNLADLYEKLTTAQRNNLAVGIAGNRQFEALEAVLRGVGNEGKAEASMMANMTEEDRLATEMLGTFKVKQEQVNAEWEGFTIAIAQGALPMLEQFMSFLASTVLPGLANLGIALHDTFANFGTNMSSLSDLNTMASAVENPGRAIADPKFRKQVSDAYSDFNKNSAAGAYQGDEAVSNGPVTAFSVRKVKGKVERDYESFSSYDAAQALGRPDQTVMRDGKAVRLGHPDEHQRSIEQLLAVQNMADEYKRGIASANLNHGIHDNYSTTASPDSRGDIIEPAAGSGNQSLSPGEAFREQMQDQQAAYDDINFAKKENQRGDDQEISHQERLTRVYGQTKQSLLDYNDAIYDKEQADKDADKALTQQIVHWKQVEAAALSAARAVGVSTKQGKIWMGDYREARGYAQADQQQVDSNEGDIDTQGDKYEQAREKFALDNLSQLEKFGPNGTNALSRLNTTLSNTKNYGDRSTDISALSNMNDAHHDEAIRGINAAGIKDEQKKADLISQENDRYVEQKDRLNELWKTNQQDLKTLKDKMAAEESSSKDKAWGDLAKASGMKPLDIASGENALKTQAALNEATKQYQEYIRLLPKDEDGLADGWLAAQQASIQAESAAAQYEITLEKIQNSSWYKGLDAAFSTIDSSLSGMVASELDGSAAIEKNIQAIEDQTKALQAQKSFMDTMYSEGAFHTALQKADHDLYLNQIEQETKALKIRQEAEQYKKDHPSIIQQVQQSFTKTYTDTMMKQITDAMMGGITQDPNSKAIQDALKGFIDVSNTKLPDAMTMFQNGVADFGKFLSNSKLGNSSGSGSSVDLSSSLNATSPLANYTPTDLSNIAAAMLPVVATMPGIGGFGSYASNAPGTGNPAASAIGDAAAMGSAGGGSWGGSSLGDEIRGGFTGVASHFGGMQGMASILSAGLAASGKSPLGSALTTLGSSFTGGSSIAKGGAGAFVDAAGNIINAFSTSQMAGWGSVIGTAAGAALGGPLGAALGSSIGGILGGLFGPHISATTNPDMFANDGYAQALANAGGGNPAMPGYSDTAANGPTWEDPQLKSELGNQTELQYLDQFVNAHPGGQGLTGEELQLWQEANQMTGSGQAVSVGNLHNGNVQGLNAEGQSVTSAQNWNSYLNQIQNATQALYGFQQSITGAQQALVVFNQYGTGSSSMPYAWNTPGYSFSPQAYQAGGGNGVQAPSVNTSGGNASVYNPVNPTGASSGNSSAGSNTAGTSTAQSAAMSGGQVSAQNPATITIALTTNLDGRAIARSTQAYMQQTATQGFTYVT